MDTMLNNDGSKLRLTLRGDLSLECGPELRSRLLELIGPGREVVLDLSEAASTDLSFWQIVVGARRSAKVMEAGLFIEGEPSDQVRRFLKRAGIDAHEELGIGWE